MFTSKIKKVMNSLGIALIIYIIVSFLLMLYRGFTYTGVIGASMSMVLFIMLKYFDVDKKLLSLLSIILAMYLLITVDGILAFLIATLILIYSGIAFIMNLKK